MCACAPTGRTATRFAGVIRGCSDEAMSSPSRQLSLLLRNANTALLHRLFGVLAALGWRTRPWRPEARFVHREPPPPWINLSAQVCARQSRPRKTPACLQQLLDLPPIDLASEPPANNELAVALPSLRALKPSVQPTMASIARYVDGGLGPAVGSTVVFGSAPNAWPAGRRTWRRARPARRPQNGRHAPSPSRHARRASNRCTSSCRVSRCVSRLHANTDDTTTILRTHYRSPQCSRAMGFRQLAIGHDPTAGMLGSLPHGALPITAAWAFPRAT